MAFNPFTTFQKNQKFWMAAILMVCMVTFVFCTGSKQADEWMMGWFRGTGPTVVTVAGRNLSSFDLTQLREQRDMANDFMRYACDITIRNLADLMQKERDKPEPTDPKKQQERKQFLTQHAALQNSLRARLEKPRYFEGGRSLDDIVEFKLWEALADQLHIRLDREEIYKLVRMEFFSPNYQFILPQQLTDAQMHAQQNHRDTASNTMGDAITREFRVRLARLAYLEMRPGYWYSPIPIPGMPTEQRVPVTLASLWKVYQEKRSELDVALIPIHVADFTKDVAKLKGPPAQSDLETLFEKNRTNRYDPDSPLPSFETPAEVRAEFIMADPTLPIYRGAVRATQLLGHMMPIGCAPMQSPLVGLARVTEFAAAQKTNAEEVLEGLNRAKYSIYGGPSLLASHITWPMALHLAERDPRAVASLVGNIAGSLGAPVLPGAELTGFLAVPTHYDAAKLKAALTEESQRRLRPTRDGKPAPGSVNVAAALVAGQPYTGVLAARLAYENYWPTMSRTVLPLPIIAPELEQVRENQIAERWASRNLMTVKRMLDRSMKPEAVKRVVEDVVPRYNLRHEVTKKFYSKYDIAKAPGLAPLREAYDRDYDYINLLENRKATPERLLKESDFYRLFFDTEPFTSSAKYQVRPWPPDVHPNQMHLMALQGMNPLQQMQQPGLPSALIADAQKFMQRGKSQGDAFRMLDRAQKPALYWRHDDKPAEFPKTLDAAKDRVVAAWEMEQAREYKALPLAKDIAEKLRKQLGDFTQERRGEAAHEAGHPEIVLDRVAPLVPKKLGDMVVMGHTDYFPYHLPKDLIDRPRDDMVQQLLNLYNLKAPIEIKTGLPTGEPAFVKELNDINKSLFNTIKKERDPQGKYVQILTNKPQTVYYVAVVTRPPTADPKDFQDFVLKNASEPDPRMPRPADTFVTRAQELLAKDFHGMLIAQLRDQLGFVATGEFDEMRKTFDRDEH